MFSGREVRIDTGAADLWAGKSLWSHTSQCVLSTRAPGQASYIRCMAVFLALTNIEARLLLYYFVPYVFIIDAHPQLCDIRHFN